MGIFKGFIICAVAVTLHEAGHIVPMCIFGYKPEKIKINTFEISIYDKKRMEKSFFQNIIIIISGPFANFICFILSYLLYLFCSKSFMPFALANISVCLFNVMPVMSLDGGQLLYLLLAKKLGDNYAEKIVNIITFIFIFPLAALGFLLLFNSKYNFSLLFVCLYLVLSLVLKNNRYY